jgi:hypothetical protein
VCCPARNLSAFCHLHLQYCLVVGLTWQSCPAAVRCAAVRSSAWWNRDKVHYLSCCLSSPDLPQTPVCRLQAPIGAASFPVPQRLHRRVRPSILQVPKYCCHVSDVTCASTAVRGIRPSAIERADCFMRRLIQFGPHPHPAARGSDWSQARDRY